MSGQNWRQEITAEDFFGRQKKITQINDRRPVVRKPSDLVGPGIAPLAVRITDFNDILATYNGYFSADKNAAHAPAPNERFMGFVVSDKELGGWQEMRSLDTGISYRRMFRRAPYDASVLHWYDWLANLPDPVEDWILVGDVGAGAPDFQNGWGNYGFGYAPARFKKISGVVHLDGILAHSSGSADTIFALPLGYRPEYHSLYSGVLYLRERTSGAASAGTAHTHLTAVQDVAARIDIGADGQVWIPNNGDSLDKSYFSLSGISFPVV